MSDPHSSPSPDVGAILGGRYRVLRRIGEGGMGVVVEAENSITGKRVAIKWMHPQVAARPEATERFLREARASARVRHPNVVDVYDAVHEGNTCFLVMELLDGEPLSALLARGGMPAHELISLLLDAMRGVSAAHKQGVIHRDIKPDNIFLAEETDRAIRIPKVLDFGISKVAGSDAMSLTRTGATLGTPMYMSFEQICGAKDIDARTDVYAFGVILYEALTGQPPYHAESFPELIVKISSTRPTSPKTLRPDIPSSLDRLVQRAMAKERDERVASRDVLIRELAPFCTASSFRAQMTEDDALLPRVIPLSDAPPKPSQPEQPSLVVEGRESSPIATPMEANVPIPSPPRRRDALPWLIGGGVVAAALGALSLYGSSPLAKQPTDSADPPGALQPAAASVPTTSQPRGPIEPALPAAPAKVAPLPAAAATGRGTQPQPSAAGAATKPQPSAASVTAKPQAPAAPKSRPEQGTRPPVRQLGGQPVAQPLKQPAAVVAPGGARPAGQAPVIAPVKEPPVPPNSQRFRAGRPRAEDF
jgi:serine/threonine protein kinase